MGKKLFLLSLILTLSWNSFSQIVTPIKDTTKITLSTITARKIAVDLIEGDQAREEVSIQNSIIADQKAVIALQDSSIILRNKEIDNLNKILEIQSVEDKEKTQKIDKLNKELKKQTALKTVFETTTGISVIALIVSLIVGR